MIEHEYLFYCSNLNVNGCFLISNPHKTTIYDSPQDFKSMSSHFTTLCMKRLGTVMQIV